MTYDEYQQQIKELSDKYPVQFEPGCLFQYGFSISKGWFELFSHLCEEIQTSLEPEILERFRWQQVKEKFGGLRAYFKLIPNPEYLVKYRAENPEDFSCYFFYCDDEDKAELMEAGYIPVLPEAYEKIHHIIQKYELIADHTCEVCGTDGEKYTIGNYITTRCQTHASATVTMYDDDKPIDKQWANRSVKKFEGWKWN